MPSTPSDTNLELSNQAGVEQAAKHFQDANQDLEAGVRPSAPVGQQYVPAVYSHTSQATSSSPTPREGCCARFISAPLRSRSWLVLFYNLIVSFAFGIFLFCWSVSSFSTAVATVWMFPVGPVFFMLSIVSWRVLGRIELRLQQAPGGGGYEYSSLPVLEGVTGGASELDFCSCAGFWSAFKILFFDSETWASVFYMMFLKLPIVLFNFIMTLTSFVVALVFCFNWIVVLTGADYGNWHGHAPAAHWLVTTEGSLLLVPLGYLLLCLSLSMSNALGGAGAKLALKVLGRDTDLNQQRQPFMGSHPGVYAGQQPSLA